MNKNFLEHYMKTKPETTEQKYLFLVDNTNLAFAIICAGFPATTLLFDQQGYDTTAMTVEQLKTLIWRYFISYWNNRRICSANGGLPPMIKRQKYYDSLQEAA